MALADDKILVIGPSWIGDMVMAQSLFIALKQQRPHATIDVLALAWTKPLLARMPEVNLAIEMPVGHGALDIKQRYRLGKQLRRQHYQQAIVLPNSWKSALIPFFARIPKRTGWKGEARYGLLNDIRTLNKQALPLMVQRFVSLAHPAADASIPPSYSAPKMLAQASEITAAPLEENQPRLILCPGAEFGSAKQWPAEYYAAVANVLCRAGWQVIIMGSQSDQQVANNIEQQCPSPHLFNLAGQTSLAEAIDLIATAQLVIANDSGLMHIAAALHIPLIVIYGATSPDFTPPLSDNAHIARISVDCGPCFQRECPEQHHRCMRDLHSDDVLQLVRQLYPNDSI